MPAAMRTIGSGGKGCEERKVFVRHRDDGVCYGAVELVCALHRSEDGAYRWWTGNHPTVATLVGGAVAWNIHGRTSENEEDAIRPSARRANHGVYGSPSKS